MFAGIVFVFVMTIEQYRLLLHTIEVRKREAFEF